MGSRDKKRQQKWNINEARIARSKKNKKGRNHHRRSRFVRGSKIVKGKRQWDNESS